MKYDIKKYLTIGAAIAGTAFMASCDDEGDDVTVNEIDTSDLADAFRDGNTRLPFNGLPPEFLQAVRISAIVESVSVTGDRTCVWPCEDGLDAVELADEFAIDFESVAFADFYCGGSDHAENGDEGNTPSINNLEVRNYVNDEDTGSFSFSLWERFDDVLVMDDVTFTVNAKLDYTLFGTYTSGTTVCLEPNLNTEGEHDIIVGTETGGTTEVGGFTIDDAFVSGRVVSGNLIEVTNEDASVTATLPLGVVVVRLDDPNTEEADPVFARLFGDADAADFDISDLDPETAGTVTVGQLENEDFSDWVQICAVEEGCQISGSFRADLNPSQGGVDLITVDGLIDDWLSENMNGHTVDGVDLDNT